jgi:hypothetical protein
MMQFGILIVSTALILVPALASDLYIYPRKGQSPEQMEKDKFACYTWAKQQSGFDPMQAPQTTSPPPPQKRTTARPLRGAAGGATRGGGSNLQSSSGPSNKLLTTIGGEKNTIGPTEPAWRGKDTR